MKVLQLCSKVPFPPKDGGCLAMLNMAEMLVIGGAEVKILAMETHKHPVPQNGFPVSFKQKFAPETVAINTGLNVFNIFKNLFFSHRSLHLVRFENHTFEKKLIEILRSYKPDFVLLDSLFTCGYMDCIKANSKAKIIYRAHNIEHLIWEEISKKTRSLFKKNYLKVQSQRLRNEELQLIDGCDAIIAITDKDSTFFHQHFSHKKHLTLPFTIDINKYTVQPRTGKKELFFIGAMDWYPNLEGIKWFIDKVWKEVILKHPTAKLFLAGKAMPEELKNLEEYNVVNYGEVEDAINFMNQFPLMIAPIFSGGGIKIKLVEAMALGKIVICNPQAASGIHATHLENILFAESSAAFIDQIDVCFSNFEAQKHLGENARKLIEKQFDLKFKSNELNLFLKLLK